MLARITGEKSKFFEPLAQLNIELHQRPGDAQTRGSGLAGNTAAIRQNQNVKFVGSFGGEQRLAHWYTAFSEHAPEPVLRQIFKILAADELRHAACYAKYLRKAVDNKPEVLPDILKMALWMIRSGNDAPKHPTTVTEPSVVGQLEDPEYIPRMLNWYLPGRDHEQPVQRRILALMAELSGSRMDSPKELLRVLRDRMSPDRAPAAA